MSKKYLFAAISALAALLTVWAPSALAIPAFARQTGQNCNACHVSFPELTPYGRYFKLSGYTLGKRVSQYPEEVPLAVMAVVGASYTKNNTAPDGSKVDTYDGKVKPQQLSVFLGGKANNHVGAFMQWTYDGIAQQFGADNADIRVTNTYVAPGGLQPDLIYGFDMNNNPTVQDVWNTAPAWSFPYMSSGSSTNGFPVSSMIDGGSDPAGQDLHTAAVGFGGYVFWKRTIYAELSFYRTDNGVFSFLDLGNDTDDTTRPYLDGNNPYWRLAYNKQWGPNSFEIGTFGAHISRYADGVNFGPTDTYKDYGFDSQYQYITDVNTWTAQATYIHEKEDWNLSGPSGNGATSNSTDKLNTFKVKGSYWYRHKYGATVGYFTSNGSADAALYGAQGALNNKPDTTGYVLEADYMPWDYVRLALQYNIYTKYLGGSTYDYNGNAGQLRSAHDNNSLFVYAWVAY